MDKELKEFYEVSEELITEIQDKLNNEMKQEEILSKSVIKLEEEISNLIQYINFYYIGSERHNEKLREQTQKYKKIIENMIIDIKKYENYIEFVAINEALNITPHRVLRERECNQRKCKER